jgi:hypothetical protein
MFFEWIGQEHHRLHVVEEWPESPQKQAVLASIQSKLQSLAWNRGKDSLPECMVCLSRRIAAGDKMAPVLFQIETHRTDLAA